MDTYQEDNPMITFTAEEQAKIEELKALKAHNDTVQDAHVIEHYDHMYEVRTGLTPSYDDEELYI